MEISKFNSREDHIPKTLLALNFESFHKSVSMQDFPQESPTSRSESYSPTLAGPSLGKGKFYSQEGLNNTSTRPQYSTLQVKKTGRSVSVDRSFDHDLLSSGQRYANLQVSKGHESLHLATPSKKKKTKDAVHPLHYPKTSEALIEFLERGHNPDGMNMDGQCPLHTYIVRQSKKKKYLDFLYTMLTHSRANVDVPTFDQISPLHMAIKVKNMFIVKLLVTFGADVNFLDGQSLTPLDKAIECNWEKAIVLLKSVGAIEGTMVKDVESTPCLSRLKSFHDTAKAKERLRQLRMRSLSARRRIDICQPDGAPSLEQGSEVEGKEDVACGSSAAADNGCRDGEVRENNVNMKPSVPKFNQDDSDSTGECFVGMRERLMTNQSLANVTLSDMENGNTLLVLSQRLQQYINIKLDLSSSFSINVDEAFAITMQQVELAKHNKTKQIESTYSFNINAGSRILFLDGGGIRGLIQIEILEQLERKTGRKVIELFDWIIGTSTGGILALGLVYAKRSLAQLRQLYFKMKDRVFGTDRLGFAYNTQALEQLLISEFGTTMIMTDIEFPKVIVTAVYKKTTMPELHFFNNCFHDEFSTQLVWKVARYTSAAPMFFREFEDYVDGGVLANNPCSHGLSVIQNYHRQIGQKLDIALVVSLGSGIFPAEELGKTDAQEFLYFGRHWLKAGHSIKSRAKSLITLLTTALVESESVARSFCSRLHEQGIPFYRFNPLLDEVVPSGETDLPKLINMLLKTKLYAITQLPDETELQMDKLVKLFHIVAQLHGKKKH